MGPMSSDHGDKATSGGRKGPRAWWLAVVAAVVMVVAIISGVAGLVSGGDDTEPTATEPSSQVTVTQTVSPSAEESAEAEESSSASGSAGEESAEPDATSGDANQKARAMLRIEPVQGRCLMPTAEQLGKAQIAFAGRVAEVDSTSGLVLINVKRWFRAEGFGGTDTIMVKAPANTPESSLQLTAGRAYLISAGPDATVSLCGFSGPRTPELRKLYESAFE